MFKIKHLEILRIFINMKFNELHVSFDNVVTVF